MDTDGFESYLDRQVESDNLSKHTRRAYLGAIRRFEDWFMPAPGEEPTLQDIKDYLLASSTADVTDVEKQGSSLNVEKAAFRKYLYTLGRSDEYDDLKMWFSEHFRSSSSGTPDYFADDELAAIREAASDDPRDHALVAILSETGIRVGEVIRLDRDDVTFDPTLPQEQEAPAAIRIDRQKRGEVVTDERPLSQRAADAIDRYLDSIGEYVPREAVGTDGMFVTYLPTPVESDHLPSRIEADTPTNETYRPTDTAINGWLSSIAERADHPDVTRSRMHAHLFRHTVGTHLGAEGYSAEQIGAFLGRASAAEEYVHLEDAGVVMDMANAAP